MKILFLLIFLTAWGFFSGPRVSWAQSETVPDQALPPEEEVGMAAEEDEVSDVTLMLASATCDDINEIESVILHLGGVVEVDIESRRGHLVVSYLPLNVSPQQMVDALARRMGCLAHIVGATGGATVR